MHVLNDRSRNLAAVMFAALMLQACDTTEAGGQSIANAAQPNADGIGGKAVPGEMSESGVIGNTVNFETDSYVLTTDAQTQLQKQADWLTQYPARTFTIEGHADERGTREYNLALGERRANAIGNYFVALGIDKTRISVISYGKEHPLCVEATEECWSQNRRGVTSINQ
jgi:peptidoglycan-associated lipoprotein